MRLARRALPGLALGLTTRPAAAASLRLSPADGTTVYGEAVPAHTAAEPHCPVFVPSAADAEESSAAVAWTAVDRFLDRVAPG